MANRSYAAGHFELAIEGQSVGRFETLLAATAPGVPPRPLQPQELFLLIAPQAQSANNSASAGTPLLAARHGSSNPRTVALKHGRGDAVVLRRWSHSTMPRELVLVALGPAGQPVARYHLENARPAKWYVPTAALGGGEVAIEEIVIAYERLRHG